MKIFLRFFILCVLLCTASTAFSQLKNDSASAGVAKGVVRDSANNYELQAATLAIYKAADNSLVSYQLTNNFGEFLFKSLPIGIPLRIVVSYIGYKTLSKEFEIDKKAQKVDFKNFNMKQGENTLKDLVVYSVPPVTMNGDTLEFNADAFEMDPNAVAEDLLRKLPGVVIWGDGTITVNGKQVSNVLVNGKPFFGGDTKVATQNLPKNAVDKVQVYQQNKNMDNPLDSTTEINIKLKGEKSFGHFGKVAAGYGTHKRYEADGNLNFFSKSTQIGVVAAANNINKVAKDVTTLMRNSTYKGIGTNIEYQPDFNMQGLNLPRSGGFVFHHDFIANPDYYNSNRLTGDYFIQNNTNKIKRNTQTILSLGDNNKQIRLDNNQNSNAGTSQNLLLKYDKHKDNNTYNLSGGFNTDVADNIGVQNSSMENASGQRQSTNNLENHGHDRYRNISLSVGWQHNKAYPNSSTVPGNININYSSDISDNNNHHETKTEFTSLMDSSQSLRFDRRYDIHIEDSRQRLIASLGSFSSWLLPRGLRSIETNLQNDIEFSTRKENNIVEDKDSLDNFENNPYLSNSIQYKSIDEKPSLNLSKSIIKGLTNRYDKNLSFKFNARWQLFYRKYTGVHAFQNITQNDQKFIPSAGISFQNNQYGDFRDSYNLNYSISADYPTLGQLAPLVDSSNLYDIRQGNLSLQPAKRQTLSFNFQHNSFVAKNPFSYSLDLNAGIINNNFADSSIIDTLGRTTHYTVNVDGYRYLSGAVNLRKSIKLEKHGLQLRYNGSVRLSKNPSYINTIMNSSRTVSSNHKLSLYYSFIDRLAADLTQDYSFYRSVQSGILSNIFKNEVRSTQLSANLNFTRKLSISSNITYNHTTSSGSGTINFTIWNASARYRLFKSNNLELKFSALDLLHQNTSIINYGSNNSITYGTVNVLQNYFMCTISYFPRKFGKNGTK